jgi:hypothetical protein
VRKWVSAASLSLSGRVGAACMPSAQAWHAPQKYIEGSMGPRMGLLGCAGS